MFNVTYYSTDLNKSLMKLSHLVLKNYYVLNIGMLYSAGKKI